MVASFLIDIFNQITPFQWGLFILCSFLIGMAKGGVPGISTVAIPIFATIFGGKMSTGVMVPLLIIADIVAVRHYYKFAEWTYLKKLIPFATIGILIALFVGNVIDDDQFKAIMGITVFGCLGLMIWRDLKKGKEIPTSRWFSILFGILGGFATMIGNAAGPIFSIYLLAMLLPKKSFIATGAMFYFILNLFKLPLHIFVWETITVESFAMNIIVLPAIVLGGVTGIWVVKHIPEKMYRWVVIVTTTISAFLLF